MQKHEREALLFAETEASKLGLSVKVDGRDGNNHTRMVLSGPGGVRVKAIACTPRGGTGATVFHVKKWIRQVYREIG